MAVRQVLEGSESRRDTEVIPGSSLLHRHGEVIWQYQNRDSRCLSFLNYLHKGNMKLPLTVEGYFDYCVKEIPTTQICSLYAFVPIWEAKKNHPKDHHYTKKKTYYIPNSNVSTSVCVVTVPATAKSRIYNYCFYYEGLWYILNLMLKIFVLSLNLSNKTIEGASFSGPIKQLRIWNWDFF